jgi:DNA-binding NarL/FixJ family response regulator
MSAIARKMPGPPEPGPLPLRVLIADDHPLMLAGIRRTLARTESVEIVGEAHSAPEVLSLVEQTLPHIVLLDLRMPGTNGADCIERVRKTWPEVKVVVLSALDDDESIDAAMGAGASAYVVKSVMPSDIANVLHQAASGNVFRGVSGPRPLGATMDPDGAQHPSLTNREQTILAAVASGKKTSAISRDLWVSPHTVKFHLTNVYRKLGAPNRTAAVRIAIERGLLEK